MLNLNVEAWKAIIREEFIKATMDAGDLIRNDAASFNRSGINPHVSFEDYGDKFLATVWAEGMDAVIAEWGSGSKMDLTNPFLPAYQASGDYNPARLEQGTTAILGRPKGTYTDLDGVTRESHGGLYGKNLEEGITFSDGTQVKFEAHEPEHFMRDAVNANRKIIQERFIQALKNSFAKIPMKGEE